jgi:hypothetical protein
MYAQPPHSVAWMVLRLRLLPPLQPNVQKMLPTLALRRSSAMESVLPVAVM